MYDGRSLFEIINHLNKTYGVGDKHTIKENMATFKMNLDMDDHLDLYYSKQEECKRIVKDLRQPIREADMAIQLVEHMGAMGTRTRATVKFNKLKAEEQTWEKANEWFREATDNLEEMEKYSGIDGDLLANAAVIKETAAQEARDEIASGMKHYFCQLAQAAVAKAETIDANAATIVALTEALVEMTATCKALTATNNTLVTVLAKCEGKTKSKPPPGFSQTGATTSHTLNFCRL